MSEKAPDRRALKTRRSICSAFAGLLTEKELHKITVQEIVDRADIGRATFYKHYLDIYDLYEKIEKDTITEIAMLALNIGEQSVEGFFKSLLSYISDYREIFRMIFSPNNTGQLYVRLSNMIEGVFRQIESEKTGISTGDRQLVYINGYRVQGCLSVIARWIWDDFQDSQEDILKTLLLLDNTTAYLLRK